MSVHSAEDYRRMFWESVSEELILDMLRCIVRGFRLADRDCADFRPAVRRDSFGGRRRAWVEQLLMELAPRFPTVEFTESMNRTKTASHVSARSGRVILTESAVADRYELPRDAAFRRSYARSTQTLLFGSASPPADAPLYVILAYGPSTATRPYYASAVIPDSDCTQAVARISLDERLKWVLQEAAGTLSEEVVADDLVIRVRATPANTDIGEEVVADDVGVVLKQAHPVMAKDATADDLEAAELAPEELTADGAQLRLKFPMLPMAEDKDAKSS